MIVMVGMDMQERMRELIMQGTQDSPERQLPAGTAPPQRRQPGQAAAPAGTAIYTGRDIWRDSMPTTTAISLLRQGRLPRRQAGLLLLQTAAAPVIIAAIGTIAIPAIPAACGYNN
jgi:hypothetical protein